MPTSIPQEPDLILTNAKVVTVDEGFSLREAIAIKGGRFLSVGTRKDIEKLTFTGRLRMNLASVRNQTFSLGVMAMKRTRIPFGLAMVVLAVAATPASEPPGDKSISKPDTIEYYVSQVSSELQKRGAIYKQIAQSRSVGNYGLPRTRGYYFFCPITDGIAAAYEASGNEYYLQKLIEYAKDMIAAGKDQNGDGYLDYTNTQYGGWDYDNGYAHSCWFISMRIPARCARVGRLGPHYSKYKSDIDEITTFVEKQVIEKAEKGKSYMTFDSWITGLHNSTADAFVGDLLVDAYLATGNTHYKDLATRFANKLKADWVLYSNGSYACSRKNGVIIPKDSKGSAMDTSHGTWMARFIVTAYRAGIVVTGEDVNAWVNTFNKNLYAKDAAERRPPFKARVVAVAVDGTRPNNYERMPHWVEFGAFDTTVHSRCTDWPEKEKSSSPQQLQNIHYYGVLALNLKLGKAGYRLSPYSAIHEEK